MLSDGDFIAMLEAASLDKAEFDHTGHVRAGYLYVRDLGLAGAIARMAEVLPRFGARFGKADLYHETVTVAFLALINERLAGGGACDWPAFAAGNPDLFEKDLLARYYAMDTLRSPLAKRAFVLQPRNQAEPFDAGILHGG
jgi:hypothetical protein